MIRQLPISFVDPRVQITIALVALVTPLNSTMLAAALPTIRTQFDIGVGELKLEQSWQVSFPTISNKYLFY